MADTGSAENQLKSFNLLELGVNAGVTKTVQLPANKVRFYFSVTSSGKVLGWQAHIPGSDWNAVLLLLFCDCCAKRYSKVVALSINSEL